MPAPAALGLPVLRNVQLALIFEGSSLKMYTHGPCMEKAKRISTVFYHSSLFASNFTLLCIKGKKRTRIMEMWILVMFSIKQVFHCPSNHTTRVAIYFAWLDWVDYLSITNRTGSIFYTSENWRREGVVEQGVLLLARKPKCLITHLVTMIMVLFNSHSCMT